MFVYDFPLSQKARKYLKFENIFTRLDLTVDDQSESAVINLIRSVIDYIDLVDGSGALKIDILKDLDKIEKRLQDFSQDAEADKDLINELLAQIKKSYQVLENFTRQRTILRDDPILSLIKPRFMTPCGVNCFDTPLFTFWMSLPYEEKKESINVWLNEIDAVRIPISTILYIGRLCSDFKVKIANNGFMQESSEACDLIEIKYPKHVRAFPIVSGFQSSLNVRFLPYVKGTTVGDIEFEIAYINLSL